MRFQSLGKSLVLAFAVLTLAACHNKEDAAAVPGGSTPEEAVQQSVILIKAGDFAGFWKHSLPPADYANLLADWNRPRPDQKPITDEDRAQFKQSIAQLTAPDAETKLYAQFQPKLTQWQQQYHDQLPVMMGIGQAILATGIAQNKTMTDNQKQQARDVLNVLLPWAQQTPWFDQVKAKQAIGIAVATTRQLDLKTPDELQQMDFATAMKKYGVAYGGIKQLLAVYGLSVDDALDSVKVSTVGAVQNGTAQVKIDYTLLGKPLTTDSDLVQVDGRWYSKDMIDSEHAQHEQLLHPAPAASASAPAPASSTVTPAAASTAAKAKP